MGAVFSGMPSVPEPSSFKIQSSGLTNDQFAYILATYGISSRRYSKDGKKDWFFDTLSKHSKQENDNEFWGRYLDTCRGKVGQALTKKFGIKTMETCLADDNSAAAYRLVMADKKEIKKLIVFDSHTASVVKQINAHLQRYNGSGGRETSCYK